MHVPVTPSGPPSQLLCNVCHQDSCKPRHELIAFDCGHVFGRSCITLPEEGDPSCLVCHRKTLLANKTTDDSFIGALKNELQRCFCQQKVYTLLQFAVAFLFEPNLEGLATAHAAAVAACLTAFAATWGYATMEKLVSIFFQADATAKTPGLQDMVIHIISPCSFITAGFICSALLNDPLKALRSLPESPYPVTP